ncbi:hypothetical protein AVEN_134913-1 [Araneus ventricosus]|uniref:Uncharacterized protein n=1 Tax=Araneus ventricosus TaxID=182803 RepID=A0A4Y2CIF2_ARAVE|nr:hypothetical protein AVEN_134913-1 [Araneus ventricosus]
MIIRYQDKDYQLILSTLKAVQNSRFDILHPLFEGILEVKEYHDKSSSLSALKDAISQYVSAIPQEMLLNAVKVCCCMMNSCKLTCKL